MLHTRYCNLFPLYKLRNVWPMMLLLGQAIKWPIKNRDVQISKFEQVPAQILNF